MRRNFGQIVLSGGPQPITVGAWLDGLNTATWKCRVSRDEDLERRLRQARAFIDRNFERSLDLDEIARQAHFSRYHFHRLFRQHYGVTPHEYLIEKRVHRARELLMETDLTITNVCLEVGFESLGSFSALFHRYVGHAPSRYRRRIFQSLWERQAAVPWCFLSSFGATGPSLAV
jgi:AraC-like DNA-binding protein